MPGNKMERFTRNAQRVLSLAQEQAENLQHGTIGAEHLLLGIVELSHGVAARVLRELGVERSSLQRAVKRLTMSLSPASGTPELSPEVKEVIIQSVDEAHLLGNQSIDTEHLLLALVKHTDSVAVEVLEQLGVSPEQVRQHTRRVLQAPPGQSTMPPQSLVPSRHLSEPTLTEQAGQALFFARQYVDQFQLLSVNPEHLLIGLVREEYGIAGLILRDMGLQPKRVEEVVTELTGAVPRTSETHPELAWKTRHLFELAVDEAQRMGHDHIHTEHLLLGLLRQRQSVAIDVLMRLGISTDILRQKTRRTLHARPLSTPPQRPSPEKPVHYVGTNSIYLIESLMKKMLDMVGEEKLTLEQANEMLATLQQGLKLNTGMQAWLTTLLNQKEQQDTRRVQITVSNRDTQQNVYTLSLALAEALAKLDQLLLATVPDNRLESVDFESDSSPLRVELRIVIDKDKTDE